MLKTILTTLALGTTLVVLSGCNTVKGLGNDIESVGEKGDEMT